MPETVNRQMRLIARPEAGVTPELFELSQASVPKPGSGEFLVRVIYLSLDPAMRGWIAEVPGYQEPVPLGEVMIGFTLGEVTASNHPDYKAGDIVYGRQGWQEWAVSDGGDIERKVDPADGPLAAAMHVLGMTGLTAYLGLLEVGQPKTGDTVVVSTAAGAVGSTVGQIAKIKGCRTVGITGSAEKVRSCLEEFGYDAALDYKSERDLSAALGAACHGGVDVYFDNTGGEISDAVLQHINVGARIVVCGIIGIKGGLAASGPRPNRQLLMKRARMEGFLVLDHMDRLSEALGDLSAWLRDGRLRYREDIVDGLENAPAALLRLLAGGNKGKMMLRIGPEPTGAPASDEAVSFSPVSA